MKQFLTIMTLLSLSLMSVSASAHTLERDNTIGAVLHIAPNDDPRAGDPATVGFSVNDLERQFSTRNCNCQLVILKGNQTLTTVTLPESLETKYTFAETGLYTVRLVGAAKNNSFSSFTIDQSVRVTQVGGGQQWPLGRVVSALVLDTALIGVFIATIYFHRKFAPQMNKK